MDIYKIGNEVWGRNVYNTFFNPAKISSHELFKLNAWLTFLWDNPFIINRDDLFVLNVPDFCSN